MTIKSPSLHSLVTFRNSQGEAARGTLLRVEGSAAVFEVYNPYSIVQLSEVLQHLTIRRGEQTIYGGRAVVNNLVNTGLMLIVSAALIDPWLEPLRHLDDDEAFCTAAGDFVARWEEHHCLAPGYRIAVGDLRAFFVALNQWLEQVRLNEEKAALNWFSTCGELLRFAAPLYEKLAALHCRFEAEAALLPPAAVGIHKSWFQRELHPLVMRSPFLHRTYHKPLGYAGDYEMMNMIHRQAPEGPTAYAKIVNTAYVRLPIAECVINRVATLEEYLRAAVAADPRSEIDILSVGCGPALEVQRFVATVRDAERAHFFMLDFNAETLAYAQERIAAAAAAAGQRVRVEFLHKSVHALLKAGSSPFGEEFQARFDFVYCAGLFDYLSDRVCARLIRLFYDWITPGGVVLVTNMHLERSHRYVLEHLADWYLIYRNEEQMARLVPGLGRQRIFTDATGINVCLEVRKGESASAR